MFVYWELHHVNARHVVGGLAERPCALEIVKDTGGLCYGIVHSESQHVVRGSVVLQCYAGPGRYQEEVYIYIYIYIYIYKPPSCCSSTRTKNRMHPSS